MRASDVAILEDPKSGCTGQLLGSQSMARQNIGPATRQSPNQDQHTLGSRYAVSPMSVPYAPRPLVAS